MLRFVLKILILAALIAVTVIFFSRFDNDLRSETNQNIIRVRDAVRYSGLDYLFTGSSYTYSGIIPEIFDSAGYKTYNLGISTAGPYFIESITDDYLAHTGNPPGNIVIDISLITFSGKSDNWITYPIHRYLNSPLRNEEIVFKYGIEASYGLMVQKSFSKGVYNSARRLLRLLKGAKYQNAPDTAAVQYKSTIENRGYEKDCHVYDPLAVKKEQPVFEALKKEKFDTEKSAYFLRMIEKYGQKGIHVIIIQIPANELEEYFNDDYLKRYDEFCSKLGKMNNVDLIDFGYLNKRLGKGCFRNIDHLNCYGAEKFTHILLNRLNELISH